MSTSYKCPYCNIRYFSNRNSYSQHVNRCINLYDVSIEESNTEVSEVTDMLLDNDDFNRIEERQSVQETENLPSGSEITDLFEYGNYDADASVSLEVISNIPERFEEILFKSSRNEDSDVENLQNEDSNIERLQNEDLDVRSESSRNEDSDVEEFPNESYADLMTLVTKYNLNNKASNAIIKFFNKHSNLSISPLPKNIETGRKYMDKMNLSRLLYYKHRILVHNNKEYFINYQPVIKCIENLLSNPEISQLFVYDYKKLEIENEQSYGEQYTGNWWKKAKESIPSVAYILSIILYSDATTTDTLGKGSLHPIYISLGNIPTWRRNKEDAKQLLGYLPILSAKDEREKKSSEFKKLVRETFHNSIKFLLDPLFTNDDDDGDGIELKIDNEIFWFFPRVSTIICDWPEACTFSLTYKSTNSNYPCHFCLVSKENLNNTRLRDDQMVLRNKENMLQYYNNGTTEKASLEPVFNYFWNIPNINVYVATVPDRMHHLDLGLYRYQIEFTKKLLFEAEGRSLVDKMNRRITLIPRHSELKIFSGGLQSIALLTADNYRNIMKVMVFVIDDLLNKDLSEVYVKWNEMYLLSRQETFKESDLKNFQEAIEKWANLFIKLFAINGYTTETYEALHKTYVKIPYRLSNKKDVEEQMMKTIRRKAIIKQNDFKKKFKTPLKFNYSSKIVNNLHHQQPPTTPAATTPAATTPAATTPAATTSTATTPTTLTTPTMPIVLIEPKEVAEASSRKKQKTVAGAIKNYYSNDDSPFTHKDANYFLNKFEEMNSRQIEMNNRQIKIEREISDIRKLLASSGIESDYTTENEFINVNVYICYKASFIETFVINSKYFEILRNRNSFGKLQILL
ncbi:hypothetical protein Glove_100g1 [Diversispora epigaea]|uniref:C2H2-type domain-containing protein n=1 Tax=Diversispora epigaea TaxID=1348612 RepID=A0A397J3Z7_9GLOM|nr:hypothetical protein Glove_100g1 [Diversispora epigaea]